MNKSILILIVIFLSVVSTTNKKQIIADLNTTAINETKITKDFTTILDEDYTLHFEIENENSQKPILVISIEPHNDSYFVSPNEKEEFKGKFHMDFGDYSHLDFEGEIIETPHSVKEVEFNRITNLVRVNTTYKQHLNIKSQEDFVVLGRVQFVIEPRCTFEEIPFGISYKNGVFTFIDPKC